MTISNPVPTSWSYDFGDITSTALAALANPTITTVMTAAKSASVTLINSGAYGSTSAKYRVVVRQDAASPTGYIIDIRLTPGP